MRSLLPREFPAFADLYPLTVQQYHGMIDAGILLDDDPVELLDGRLMRRPPKTPSHRVARVLLIEWLTKVVPAGHHLQVQDPITMASSEPEPDASIIRGDPDDYERHPGPGDTPLVIEVSDDSLERDRNWKRRIYAAAGIPVYWIVNLIDRQLEVYAEPAETPVGWTTLAPTSWRRRRPRLWCWMALKSERSRFAISCPKRNRRLQGSIQGVSSLTRCLDEPLPCL
jgi:Uma2 family endonuclease